MSIQLVLRFDEVPITCEIQQRYHSIGPCLAGKQSAEEQADALGLAYSTLCRWLQQFRTEFSKIGEKTTGSPTARL